MKGRGTLTPIALVILASAAAAYAYLVDRDAVSDSDRAVRRSDVFPSFRVDEVTRVELSQGGETLVLRRDDDAGTTASWAILSPRREPADPAAVDVLLRELEQAKRQREVADPGHAMGLDPPRATGVVQVGSLVYRFALGADAPRPEGAAYLRLDGEGTLVVDRALKVQLMRGADAYRDRRLVALDATAITRLEVHATSGYSFALEREGPAFHLTARGLRAGRAVVSRLMTGLADARAETFLGDAAAASAMGTPAFVVTVTPREARGQSVELRVGGECPGQASQVVVARVTPTPVSACVARSLLDALTTSEEDLVDASPFFAHADEMEELRLEPRGQEGPVLDMARRGTGWHERSPVARELTAEESDSANGLALALAETRGRDVERAGPGFDARVRVTVIRAGGGTSEVVELAPTSPDGTVPVRRADDGAVLRLSRAQARRFEPHPVVLEARAMWRTPIEPASVVAVEDRCGPTPQRLELHDGSWSVGSPPGLPGDARAVTDLVETVARAKVDKWLAETDDGSFGLEGPGACRVTLFAQSAGPDAGSRRAVLVIGAAGEGGYYARSMDSPAVGVVSEGLRQTLVHPAIDRSPFHVEVGAGADVMVLRDGTRRVLSGQSGGDDPLSTAVAALDVETALHAGPALSNEGMNRPTLEIVATANAPAAARVPKHVRIGARTVVDGVQAYFARVSGLDATFAVREDRVRAILDAMATGASPEAGAAP